MKDDETDHVDRVDRGTEAKDIFGRTENDVYEEIRIQLGELRKKIADSKEKGE